MGPEVVESFLKRLLPRHMVSFPRAGTAFVNLGRSSIRPAFECSPGFKSPTSDPTSRL